MKHIVLGRGEVGRALIGVLGCDSFDLEDELPNGSYDIIHVCFPYSDNFVQSVKLYQATFNPKHTVIHSTVPVGTSFALSAIHSPIRGVHPHLEPSVRTFVKYLGGAGAQEIAEELSNFGITCEITDKPETTELMKLVDTTSYGVNILIEKEINRLCQEYDVPFEMVYTHANKTYNKGYLDMGMPQFQKYNIEHRDGAIGGHCIMPNSKLFSSWMNDLLNDSNINK